MLCEFCCKNVQFTVISSISFQYACFKGSKIISSSLNAEFVAQICLFEFTSPTAGTHVRDQGSSMRKDVDLS